MANLRTFGMLIFLIGLGLVSGPMRAHAEWWRLYAPKDFEECSQSAQQPGLSKDAQAKIISECDSRFAGRRKAGGGYTYFDFMQNRHFDIAGPTPTQQELKQMDQEYLAYLEANPEPAVDVASAEQAIAAINKQIRPVVTPPKITVKPPVAVNHARTRKNAVCKDAALSCGWAKLTTTVRGLRHALLGADAKRDTHAQRRL